MSSIKETHIPLKNLIRVRDERVELGDSNYYYFSPIDNKGYVIRYTNFDDIQTESPLSEVFKCDKDVMNCNEGIKSRLQHYKNRLDCMDYKESEKKDIENMIEKLGQYLELFSSNYEMFIRKIKILKVLE